MSKPTFEEVVWAVYVTKVNLDGTCPYCRLSMKGASPELKEDHFNVHHVDEPEVGHAE